MPNPPTQPIELTTLTGHRGGESPLDEKSYLLQFVIRPRSWRMIVLGTFRGDGQSQSGFSGSLMGLQVPGRPLISPSAVPDAVGSGRASVLTHVRPCSLT